MYHISQDKRAQASALLLCHALNELLLTRPFTDITVTDLQKAAAVGRTTFYRLFDNVSDVMVYQCDRLFENTLKAHPNRLNTSPVELAEHFISQILQEQALLRAIMACGRPDFLLDAHRKYQEEAIAYFFPEDALTQRQKVVFNSIFAALLSIIVTPEAADYSDSKAVMADVRTTLKLVTQMLA